MTTKLWFSPAGRGRRGSGRAPMPVPVALLFLTTVLAGCSGDGEKPQLEVQVKASVCVKLGGCELVALSQAAVTVQRGRPDQQTLRTDESGLVRFTLGFIGPTEVQVVPVAWKVPARTVPVNVGSGLLTQTIVVAELTQAEVESLPSIS